MDQTSISADDIRKALLATMAAQGVVVPAQSESEPLAADRAIITYLNERSRPVYGIGARFFLPVAAKFGEEGGGEKLVHGPGPQGGQPIEEGGFGVKFPNATDGIEQGVPGTGQGVIIIGGAVSEVEAMLLRHKLRTLTSGTGNPEMLSLKGIHEFIAYAQHIGLTDIWSGDQDDVLRARAVDGHAVQKGDPLVSFTGHFAHDPAPGKEVAAVYVRGGAEFRGDIAGMQDYSKARGFYVTIGVRDGKAQYRGIETDAFQRDYIDKDKTQGAASMLFNIDAQTHAVTPPPTQRGRTDHDAIAEHKPGGRQQ